MSRGTGSVRVASQGLSCPFLKTVAAVFPDPTDRLQASKDCKRPPKRQRHSGRLLEEVAYEKKKKKNHCDSPEKISGHIYVMEYDLLL